MVPCKIGTKWAGVRHLVENVAAAGIRLSDDEFVALDTER